MVVTSKVEGAASRRGPRTGTAAAPSKYPAQINRPRSTSNYPSTHPPAYNGHHETLDGPLRPPPPPLPPPHGLRRTDRPQPLSRPGRPGGRRHPDLHGPRLGVPRRADRPASEVEPKRSRHGGAVMRGLTFAAAFLAYATLVTTPASCLSRGSLFGPDGAGGVGGGEQTGGVGGSGGALADAAADADRPGDARADQEDANEDSGPEAEGPDGSSSASSSASSASSASSSSASSGGPSSTSSSTSTSSTTSTSSASSSSSSSSTSASSSSGAPAPCAHNPCVPGVALDPACAACVAHTCASWPGCCTTAWSSTCVTDAAACAC